MSIALSVCIKPSPTLARMALLMCALSNGVLLYIAYSVKSLELYWRLFLLLAGLLTVLALVRFFRSRVLVNLDISKTGNMILRIPAPRNGAPAAFAVRLNQRSTFWPVLLLLHLQPDVGPAIILPVLPDSVAPDVFRKFFVSLRWISAHASGQNILKNDVSSGNF